MSMDWDRLQTATDGALISPRQYAVVVISIQQWQRSGHRGDSVKNNGVTLTGGAFNAGATLVVVPMKKIVLTMLMGQPCRTGGR